MHKLLQRQLRKCSLDRLDALSSDVQKFVALVQEAYEQTDSDRNLLEHSLELTSQEMMDRYQKMLKEIEHRKQAEGTLLQNNRELKVINETMLGREERIMELKKEVNALLLELSKQPRYGIDQELHPFP